MQWRARNILRLRDETATLNKDLSPGLRPGLFYLLKDYIYKSNRCLWAAFLRLDYFQQQWYDKCILYFRGFLCQTAIL